MVDYYEQNIRYPGQPHRVHFSDNQLLGVRYLSKAVEQSAWMLNDFVKEALTLSPNGGTLVVLAHADAQNLCAAEACFSLKAMVADQFTAQRQGTTAFHGLMRLRFSSCTTSLIVTNGNRNSSIELRKCQTVEQVALALLRCIVCLREPLLIS